MGAHIGVESQGIPRRHAQGEVEIGTGQLQQDAVDRLELEPGSARNGERGCNLDSVVPVPAGGHRADIHINRTGLFRPVLLNSKHNFSAGGCPSTVGDPALDCRRGWSTGGDGQITSLNAAAGARGKDEQHPMVTGSPVRVGLGHRQAG